mgnify:CR=1 FL=1
MNRLRELRKERGLSQKKLAELVRVHTRTVQHWEYGTSQIKLKKAEELADILGVGVHELLGFKTEKEFKLPKGKEYILFLNNILIGLIKDGESMTAQELSDIKRIARNLYENLVQLQYDAERTELE